MKKRKSFNFTDAGIGILLAFGAYLAVSFIVSFFYGAMNSALTAEELTEKMSSDMGLILISSLAAQATFILFYFIFCHIRNVSPLPAAGLKKPGVSLSILAVIAVFITLFCFGYAAELFDRALYSLGYRSLNALNDVVITSKNIVWFTIIIGILPAFGEELVFRGIFLNSLNAKYNETSAVLVSAAMFALFHGSPDQTVYQFLLGIILGYIALRGGIVPAMIVHGVNNLFNVVMTYFNFGIWFDVNVAGLIVMAVCLPVLALAALTVLIDLFTGCAYKNPLAVLYYKIKKLPGEKRAEYLEKEKAKALVPEENFIAPPPVFTGDPMQDNYLTGQYEYLKATYEKNRRSAVASSKIGIVVMFVACAAMWAISFAGGFL